MTSDFFVSLVGALSVVSVCIKGVRWTFAYVYLATLLIVPLPITLSLAGLPDLTPRRAACVGLVLGAIIIGKGWQLAPRWHWFDVVALVPVLTFSVSYGLITDFKGFYHRLGVFAMDWACPYFLVRALFRDIDALRPALRTIACCTMVLAFLAVYECRMATRLAVDLWNMVGPDVPVPPHYTHWRWGYIRAAATWGGGLPLGTMFTTCAPLMVLWGLIGGVPRWKATGASLACAAGCVAAMSRGPMLVLAALASIFPIIAARRRWLFLILVAVPIVGAPLLVESAREEVTFTQGEMDEFGNTTSGHYRVALLLIYGQRVLDVGWWGDPGIVGLEYEHAWSVDNAYLYFFLTGGWLGGGAFCSLIAVLLCLGARRIAQANGHERKVAAAVLASFAGVAGCMANLWFAPEYAPLFWITAAIVLNLLVIRPSERLRVAEVRRRDFAEQPGSLPAE